MNDRVVAGLVAACTLSCSADSIEKNEGLGELDAGLLPVQAAPSPQPQVTAESVAVDAGVFDAIDLATALGPDPLAEHCAGAPSDAYSPRSIDELVDTVNRLPKPVTLACFLRALRRPLAVVPVKSVISAQPAVGERSPRTFLFLGQLVLSIVPEGVGSRLLEMSFLLSDTRSIKAELVFPISEKVERETAYEDILFSTSTGCAQCHADEVEISGLGIPRAFVSEALRPKPSQQLPLDVLKRAALDCDVYGEAERCGMLHGLMLYGPVEEHSFPESMPLFGP